MEGVASEAEGKGARQRLEGSGSESGVRVYMPREKEFQNRLDLVHTLGHPMELLQVP